MPELVGYLLLFLLTGVLFILVHLLIGKLIRPAKPSEEKLTIYECGEPTVGSAWIQFDVRYYVVALLFVIFDVEVAFFFPWAVVFGKLNDLGKSGVQGDQRIALNYEIDTEKNAQRQELEKQRRDLQSKKTDQDEAGVQALEGQIAGINSQLDDMKKQLVPDEKRNAQAARRLGRLAFIDLAVFFGVLLVGFAYLWKRGDVDWVRSTAAEDAGGAAEAVPVAEPNP
jgi:NADH-quinone oxidoreductase subunit A